MRVSTIITFILSVGSIERLHVDSISLSNANPADPDNNPIYGIRKEAVRDCKQTSPILQMARRFSSVITWHARARFRVLSQRYRGHIRR